MTKASNHTCVYLLRTVIFREQVKSALKYNHTLAELDLYTNYKATHSFVSPFLLHLNMSIVRMIPRRNPPIPMPDLIQTSVFALKISTNITYLKYESIICINGCTNISYFFSVNLHSMNSRHYE